PDQAHAGTATPRRLKDFFPDDAGGEHLAVTVADGADLVILRRISDRQVVAWQNDQITVWNSDTEAVAISDPTRRNALLQAALLGLARLLRTVTSHAEKEEAANQQILADIREYAIGKHEAGYFCRSGLNEFLEAFDLPEYQPRLRVRYTVSGSYDVDNGDIPFVCQDVRDYLRVDLGGIDDVVDGSDTFRVDVESVEELAE
ncbi:MAG: hypothetical protein QG597_3884, partial [Actinomycetota bacterium]|nr:hypothetical protein [Actinomycetota bacterium]